MQKVAAYLLERSISVGTSDDVKAEGGRIRAVIEAWLRTKGASCVDGSGTYQAPDQSDARLEVTAVNDGNRSWRLFQLSEVTPEHRRFLTSISVTIGHSNVTVFVTMEVGSTSSSISRIEVDPKCPRVVRDLLALPGHWYHGASQLRSITKLDGFDAGETLALELKSAERTIPFVVVSRVAGQPVLPMLDDKLAHDLAGVANVYSIDEQASWALTDSLRKPLSTYGGGLRIYWPRLSDDPFRHQLWIASRLSSLGDESIGSLDRIRRQVRTIIMRASAVSVVRPSEIEDIRGAKSRDEQVELLAKANEIEALKAKAKSLEDFQGLADMYAAENDTLRQKLAEQDLEMRRLEADKDALLFQFERMKGLANEPSDIESDAPEQDERAPKPGEVRFYKKTHSTPAYDVLVRRGDCGHASWQSSNKADKAKKGLERLLGDMNWNKVKLQHCGRCDGGGVWRVEW